LDLLDQRGQSDRLVLLDPLLLRHRLDLLRRLDRSDQWSH
jgi:hypothetical protein